MIRETLEYVSQGLDLSQVHAERVMNAIMDGEWTPSQIAGLLIGLKIKGESVSEVTGFVKAMRQKAVKLDMAGCTVDTCGTGGDGHHTFNISTASAIVAAAAGVPIAKHGNRSVSSKCGSADVLQELGVKIDMSPQDAQNCLKELGIAFLFAPVYHASMKYAVTPRRELGVRTVFNMLGPMSNPAMARRQVVGTFNRDAADKVARVLENTGSEHVMVVHSGDGMDEIAISAETYVNEYKNGKMQSFTVTPEEFGIKRTPLEAIKGGMAADNARIMQSILDGKDSPFADITILNAGAAIYVAGSASTFSEGVNQARDVIKSGDARNLLVNMIEFSNSISQN